MTRIVFVHGIGQQLGGPQTLHDKLAGPMRDGITNAGAQAPAPEDIRFAFYGKLFRKPGGKGLDIPMIPEDLQSDEVDVLIQMWQAAASTDQNVPDSGGDTKVRAPQTVQRALDALSRSRFFAGLANHVLLGSLRQVRLYLTDPVVRAAIRGSVEACIESDTRVIVGHSLGSVVAYEALAAHPEWPVRSLVTLGSPLGIQNLVFHRLDPRPDKRGAWPGPVHSWINVADKGDLVALRKKLAPLFDDRVQDVLVDNGAQAHDASPYLTAEETGRAIHAALNGAAGDD
jgi:hypothetical protein